MTSRTKTGEAATFFSEALQYVGDSCLIWPYRCSPKGYGEILYEGKKRFVQNVICRLTYGEPPTKKHEAAHICGVRPCCNPQHIKWKTHKENCLDTIEHGTVIRGEKRHSAKLTENDVREIRSLEGSMTRREIRELYGIGQTQLHMILHRKKWSWLD